MQTIWIKGLAPRLQTKKPVDWGSEMETTLRGLEPATALKSVLVLKQPALGIRRSGLRSQATSSPLSAAMVRSQASSPAAPQRADPCEEVTHERSSHRRQLRKNSTEETRVSGAQREGYALIEFRVFADSPRVRGEPHATKAGICVVRDRLPALVEALQAAEREVSR